jgi:hypothetical protein
LFTPARWTRKYTIHTSPNFERSKDQKIAAKVLVTAWVRIPPQEKNGPTMITHARVRKLRASKGPALVRPWPVSLLLYWNLG